MKAGDKRRMIKIRKEQPADHDTIRAVNEPAIAGVRGVARYRDEFDKAMSGPNNENLVKFVLDRYLRIKESTDSRDTGMFGIVKRRFL